MTREGWIEVELGKVLRLKNGYAFKSSMYQNEGVPIIRISDINQGTVTADCAIRIKELKEYDSYQVEFGDILIAMSGATTGKFGIYRERQKSYQNQRVGNLKLYSNRWIIKKYIYYLLFSIRQRILEDAYGGAQPNISAKNIEAIKFFLAPLPEQRAIVSKIEQLFSELDNGIVNLKNAKENLEIYRQAVLKKAFEGELTNIKDIEWVTLGEVCDGVEYGTSSKSEKEGTVPVLRMGNIQNGEIDWEDLKFTSNKEEIIKYRLNKGDVLFNRTNSPEHVGKTAIFRGEREAIFAGYLIRIKYNKEVVNGYYLNYFLNCHIAKIYGNKVKSFGVNQSNINGTKLKKYPFPKTSMENQAEIVYQIESRLSVCDNILANIEEGLEKAEALRQSILKRAFEGKLLSEDELKSCRKEPDWEPAEKLLERIKKENRGLKI
ncbi:restriction endonuclease subunit S [Cytobacillus sp. Hz8]|uniref:restriction endonuclease subunit S n=1 Tax=Cytobacillus sp. Hz8 TaxID=3347168 RepID=UPI0035D8AFC7